MRNSFIVIVWLVIISLGVVGWLGQSRFGWWSNGQVAENTDTASGSQSISTNRPDNIQPSATQPAGTKAAETKTAEPKPSEAAASTDAPAADATRSGETEQAASQGVSPSFDIVRVEPDGTAVIAGRAEPGASVSVVVDGKPLVAEKANERGEWAIVVEDPISPGDHNVTLSSNANGKTVVSDQSVAISLPDRKDEKPLIVLSKKGEASKILQAPEKTPEAKSESQVAAQQPATAEPAGSSESGQTTAQTAPATGETITAVAPSATRSTGGLALKTVDYDDRGNMIFTGTAMPEETVRIYVNNKPIADAKADLSGVWTLRVVKEIEPGNHNLRVDQLGKDSKVASRIELPFTRVDPERVIAALNQGKVPKVKQPSAATSDPKLEVVESTESAAATASATNAPDPSTTGNAAAGTPEAASGGETGASTETADAGQAGNGDSDGSIVAQAVSPSTSSDAAEQPSAGAETENQVAAVIPPSGAGLSSIGTQTQAASTLSGNGGEVVQRVGRVIIQPGNNLWNISRVIYGSGVSYTAIYQANKGQIRDPHLIYPGQIFTTPGVVPPEQIRP